MIRRRPSDVLWWAALIAVLTIAVIAGWFFIHAPGTGCDTPDCGPYNETSTP